MSRQWGLPELARAERRQTHFIPDDADLAIGDFPHFDMSPLDPDQDANHGWSGVILGVLAAFVILAFVFFIAVAVAIKLGVLEI